ncbi:hypothetical protein U6A24_14995 [Aquimarina gracilis]|uniref:Bacteriocin-like protein n=1 Tax=Aquimarina gracilis TaxID=874422 RepID=A0ABU5ZY37_9FLAO|nr:hypothetical protein [Aquimarina gracilis]MEB3346783.1 hypothetical protein [Aquimarina gracilis]
MKNFERLKQSNYRALERKEASLINGGGNPCNAIRANCAARCGNDYDWCFHTCVSDAGCPV